ncbi:MAG: hypothetical protein ACRCTZ_15120 [Sarcina sp.]
MRKIMFGITKENHISSENNCKYRKEEVIKILDRVGDNYIVVVYKKGKKTMLNDLIPVQKVKILD